MTDNHTPVDRMREVLLAEREVIEAAEKWAERHSDDSAYSALIDIDFAVPKLREVRTK